MWDPSVAHAPCKLQHSPCPSCGPCNIALQHSLRNTARAPQPLPRTFAAHHSTSCILIICPATCTPPPSLTCLLAWQAARCDHGGRGAGGLGRRGGRGRGGRRTGQQGQRGRRGAGQGAEAAAPGHASVVAGRRDSHGTVHLFCAAPCCVELAYRLASYGRSLACHWFRRQQLFCVSIIIQRLG